MVANPSVAGVDPTHSLDPLADPIQPQRVREMDLLSRDADFRVKAVE